MTDAVLNKMAFNGYHVTFLNHDNRRIEKQSFPSIESVVARGFTRDGDPFPDAETFADDLFTVFGDTVGKIIDNAGAVLLENMTEMMDEFNDPMFR